MSESFLFDRWYHLQSVGLLELLNTLPETNSSAPHLGWKRNFPFGDWPPGRCEPLVSGV